MSAMSKLLARKLRAVVSEYGAFIKHQVIEEVMLAAATELEMRDQSPLSAVATADPIRAALHELVDLKTIKEQCDDFRGIHPDKEVEYWKAYHDYQRRQPLAWAAAREALRVSPQTKPEPKDWGRAKVGVDGNCGYALLGADLQEGEAEFVEIKREENESIYRAERRAWGAALKKLEERLGSGPLRYEVVSGVYASERGREEWRVMGYKPQGPESARFQIEPLFAVSSSATGGEGVKADCPLCGVSPETAKHCPPEVQCAAPVKVIKVRMSEGGSDLILRESEKDQLWDYCQDWLGKIEIRFTTMPKAEVDALPEWDGG